MTVTSSAFCSARHLGHGASDQAERKITIMRWQEPLVFQGELAQYDGTGADEQR